MQHGEEWQEERRMLIQVPVQYGWNEDGVAEAADGEGFGNTLHDSEYDGLKERHGACEHGLKGTVLAPSRLGAQP
ncbi:hypothetical protein GWA01_11920 [Gluconobacter wancherniae NBRC 103581]|uniref:Uncharacterized protein n=1 Tax=Gluconobacter wancherniae NBRC 103581 TaxID=656744 RepID=A0A511B0U1_9PROT|nr:hypothetical protein GWA01_11920 [Gluconobacter wancherniae NBRC 103581]